MSGKGLKKHSDKPHVKPTKEQFTMRDELAVRPDELTVSDEHEHELWELRGQLNLPERAREHALRHDGAGQMAVFLSCIEHLRLPRDIVNILRHLVCDEDEVLYLVGGVMARETVFDNYSDEGFIKMHPTTRVARLQKGIMCEVAPLPMPLFGASAAYYEGELLVVGGFLGTAYQGAAPTLISHSCGESMDIWIYNILDDEWRAVPVQSHVFRNALRGYCSVSVYKHLAFVCGAKGACVAIDARTMTAVRMPHRGTNCLSSNMQTALMDSGLLVCWGTSMSCRHFFQKGAETDSMDKCCCSLHVLDVRTFLEDPVAARWVQLPTPPVNKGHVSSDATMFVRGTCIYLVGGSNVFDPLFPTLETTDIHRVLDLAHNDLVWRFDNLGPGKGCAGMLAKQLRTGAVFMIGGMDATGRFESEPVLDGAVVPGVKFEGIVFASATVPAWE